MKVSLVLPAYNRGAVIENSLNNWFRHEGLPDEIIVMENYPGPSSPEPLEPILRAYSWSQSISVRHYYCDTRLRSIYPDRESAVEISYKKLGGFVSKDEIARIWESGGTVINSGTSIKNAGVRAASGEIVIIADAETFPENDAVEIAKRWFSEREKIALFPSRIYECEPNTSERAELIYQDKPYGYTMVFRREEYIACGGLDEMFDPQWGWDDEALNYVVLPRHGIKKFYPPRFIILHQRHKGRVYVDHNETAKQYYMKIRPGPWVSNESRGWMDWGTLDGWREIGRYYS